MSKSRFSERLIFANNHQGQMRICFVFGVQILVTLNKNAGEVTSRLDSENQPGGSTATLGDSEEP